MKSSQKKAKAKVEPKLPVQHKSRAGFERAPGTPPEWLETNKRNEEIMERFESVFIDRVGSTPKDRLAWVVKMVNTEPQTPADWENLLWEMAVFCRNVGAHIGHPTLPTQTEAADMRENFRSIVKKIVEGKDVEFRPRPMKLKWFANKSKPAPKSMAEAIEKIGAKMEAKRRGEPDLPLPRDNDGRWRLVPTADFDWDEDSVNELVELIVQYGNLLRECRAPAPRSDKPCGTWFVARRHKSRVYCSAQCTSRAATQLWRKSEDTK